MFFLYDNGSTDNTREMLEQFNYCTYLMNWDIFPGQKTAYDHAIRTFGTTSMWMAFIDADEFLYSKEGKLSDALTEYEYASAVAVHWLLFGSNGKEEYSDAPVVTRFTKRAAAVNPHVKSIVQPRYVNGIGPNVHTFDVQGDVVDEKQRHLINCRYALQENGTADKFAINHYHTKSKGEYREKCLRGRADTGEMRDFESSFKAHDVNEVEDLYLFNKRK